MSANNQELLDKNIKDNWFAGVGVRKPYTVFVCIMAIIILGLFAFTRMSVDLFPAMNLPYAVVVVSPNQAYVTEEVSKLATSYTTTDQFKGDLIDRITAIASEKYSDNQKYNSDKNELLLILSKDQSTQETELPVAIANGNLVAGYYAHVMSPENLTERQAISMEILLAKVMPGASVLENLTNTTTQAISGVTGVKSVESNTMLSMGVVMLAVEYHDGAIVDLTELNMAFENLGLDNDANYGIKYNKTILKIDPSLLPVMNITVAFEGKNSAWFRENVLDRVSSTVGVGSISSNMEDAIPGQDQNKAWQNLESGLVDTYSMSIQKNGNAITADVCANVIVTLDKIKAENPGFTYDVTNDQGEYIKQTIGSVWENLIVGGVLALLILFLFLRSLKMTLAIGISIPLALVGTFVAMFFMGINLNIVSMAGLALAVGMLVDNSVVVLENIFRLRSKGFPLRDACVQVASQIMLATLASSLTTICAFFPLLSWE
ncbi:MAG: efflux RND transporter permease subunit, partial [Clostridia bacterium]|nr:efflux RND transporter permease subunit [Clostridia bacterium]